jgi:beta-lactam-binding protein with PASTA domain
MKVRVRYRNNAGELTAGAISAFRIAMTVMAMTTVALLSALITMRLAIHTSEVEVPNLSGLTVEEAATKSTRQSLNLTVENRFYSTTVPAGRVLSQSPAAGATVRKGWHMRITESMGPQKVPIPDVVGMNEHDAGMAIRRSSLDIGALAHIPAPGPIDVVLAQTPPANAEGVDKPEVGLLLSEAATAAPRAYVMPRLVGLSWPAASAKMREMDLRLWAIVPQPPAQPVDPAAPAGTAPPPPPPMVPAGVVVTQTPVEGTRVSLADNAHVKMSAGAVASPAAPAATPSPAGGTPLPTKPVAPSAVPPTTSPQVPRPAAAAPIVRPAAPAPVFRQPPATPGITTQRPIR